MDEETKMVDPETAAEKRKRLRAARELAEEARQDELDEKYQMRSMLTNKGKLTAREIHLEYAKVILEKVLDSKGANVLSFAYGNSEEGEKAIALVGHAVNNMAWHLTKRHVEKYP